jgi:DNA-binding SARP family transcriptional activator
LSLTPRAAIPQIICEVGELPVACGFTPVNRGRLPAVAGLVQAWLVQYRLLGEFEASDAGRPIEIPPGRQRSLLALLLIHKNTVVSTERLVDELWDESPPATAEKTIHVYVSRLRKRIPAGRLVTRGSGYLLRVEEGELDADRFESMLRDGRHALAAGEARRAARVLADGLALWRGSALADFRYEPFAQAEIARLEELRLAAQIELADAELALGRHEQLVPQLRNLLQRHPLQERLRGQLMLALYRSGRQSEALESYREGRNTLVAELGIEPGPELKELEQAILRQDARLPGRGTDGIGVAKAEFRRRRLPRRLMLAVAATLVAGIALAAVLVARKTPNEGAVPVASRSVAAVDPADGSIVADVRVDALPGPAAAGIGRIWVGTGARLLVAINTHSRRIVGRAGLPAPPHQLAAGDGIVWIGDDYDGTVSRLDERIGFVSRPFRPQRRSTGRLALATGFGSLWVGSQDGRVARIDPSRDRLVATIEGIRAPEAIAAGEGAVWVIDATRPALSRIDPRTNRMTGKIALGSLPTAVGIGAGSVWVATSDGRVWRIDPQTNRICATISTGGSPVAVEATGPLVWVADANGTLRGIDPSLNEVTRTVEVRRPIADLVSAEGLLWMIVQ